MTSIPSESPWNSASSGTLKVCELHMPKKDTAHRKLIYYTKMMKKENSRWKLEILKVPKNLCCKYLGQMKLLNFHLKTQTFIWYTIHPIWDFSYVLMAAHCVLGLNPGSSISKISSWIFEKNANFIICKIQKVVKIKNWHHFYYKKNYCYPKFL